VTKLAIDAGLRPPPAGSWTIFKGIGVDCCHFRHPAAQSVHEPPGSSPWLVGIHVVFMISTLLLALSDRAGARGEETDS
jgi:hypothetical protein